MNKSKFRYYGCMEDVFLHPIHCVLRLDSKIRRIQELRTKIISCAKLFSTLNPLLYEP